MHARAAASLEAWHKMIAVRDLSKVDSLFCDTIIFRSPVFHAPYPGKAAAKAILNAALATFENFEYARTFETDDGSGVALEFTAQVNGKALKGFDVVTFGADGLMVEFEVLVRPANALQALGEAMMQRVGPALKAIKQQG